MFGLSNQQKYNQFQMKVKVQIARPDKHCAHWNRPWLTGISAQECALMIQLFQVKSVNNRKSEYQSGGPNSSRITCHHGRVLFDDNMGLRTLNPAYNNMSESIWTIIDFARRDTPSPSPPPAPLPYLAPCWSEKQVRGVKWKRTKFALLIDC